MPVMNKTCYVGAVVALATLPGASHALQSDREQPAIIDADSVNVDFSTGKWIYEGGVTLRQGTIRLEAERLDVYFKDDRLEEAVAVGEPVVFSQRPDGKEHDLVGRAGRVHLDERANVVTLTQDAVLTQGRDSIAGETITYDMANDRMQVLGGDAPARAVKAPETTAAERPAAGSDPGGVRATATLDPQPVD